MSTFSKIIRYFANNKLDNQLEARFWKRLSEGKLDKDSEEELHNIWDDAASTSMTDSERDRAFEQVSSLTDIEGRKSANRWGTILRVAVWIVPIILLLGSGWLFHKSLQHEQQIADVRLIQVFNNDGNVRKIILPDSTQVWLNGGSVLVYPSTFIGERNITLVGEAYFKVKHNDSQPFSVHVNDLRLSDIGTSFNVSGFPDAPQTTVTLESGLLAVNVANRQYKLKPNDQLEYSNKDGKVTLKSVTANDYCSWRTNTININDEDFRSVLFRLEKSYGVTFHVQTSRYDGQKVRMHFDSHERLDNVMSVFAALIPGMTYDISGKDIYIR